MRMLPLLLVTLAVSGAAPVRAEDQPAAENQLAPFERFVGEWVVDGKWATGEALHARGVYAWGLGKKILKAQTWVRDGDREYQRYESVLTWHPEKKSLYEITFAFDGSISEVLIESKDQDTLRIGWMPFRADKPQNVRQVIKFLDKDHFQWIVELRQGAEWKQLIDATWKRTPK